MGLVGRTRRIRKAQHNPSLHLHAPRRLSLELCLKPPQFQRKWTRQWPLIKAFPLCIRLLPLFKHLKRTLHKWALQAPNPAAQSPQSPVSQLLPFIPPHLTAPLNCKIRTTNLLHPPWPLSYPQIPDQINVFGFNLDNVPPTLRNQHLLL